MGLYDTIKKLAKDRGIPICELEKQTGLSSGSVCKWNTVSPSVKSLLKVCEVLGVGLDEVMRHGE